MAKKEGGRVSSAQRVLSSNAKQSTGVSMPSRPVSFSFSNAGKPAKER